MNTVKKVEVVVREEDKIRQERFALRPPLSEVLNLHDFEVRHSMHLTLCIYLTIQIFRLSRGWS